MEAQSLTVCIWRSWNLNQAADPERSAAFFPIRSSHGVAGNFSTRLLSVPCPGLRPALAFFHSTLNAEGLSWVSQASLPVLLPQAWGPGTC